MSGPEQKALDACFKPAPIVRCTTRLISFECFFLRQIHANALKPVIDWLVTTLKVRRTHHPGCVHRPLVVILSRQDLEVRVQDLDGKVSPSPHYWRILNTCYVDTSMLTQLWQAEIPDSLEVLDLLVFAYWPFMHQSFAF